MTKGMALTIGINSVDPKHYDGWSGELDACEFDAIDYAEIAKSRNFQVKTLLTKEANRANVINEISKAANTLETGDMFMLSYSGHGGQVPDYNDDEKDGMDETMCLYDGQLIDDELNSLFAKFAEGVRILVFSDSCHSGTVTKAVLNSIEEISSQTEGISSQTKEMSLQARYRYMPDDVCMRVYIANQNFYDKILQDESLSIAEDGIKASVLLLSGCQDDQFSRDGMKNGLFTSKLLYVWKHGGSDKNYRQFYYEICRRMPEEQIPNFYLTGKIDPKFEKQQVFEV